MCSVTSFLTLSVLLNWNRGWYGSELLGTKPSNYLDELAQWCNVFCRQEIRRAWGGRLEFGRHFVHTSQRFITLRWAKFKSKAYVNISISYSLLTIGRHVSCASVVLLLLYTLFTRRIWYHQDVVLFEKQLLHYWLVMVVCSALFAGIARTCFARQISNTLLHVNRLRKLTQEILSFKSTKAR